MDEKMFFEKMSGVLQVDKTLVQPDYSLISSHNWDSFAMMETIALIDEFSGITVPITELSKCQTAGAIIEVIRRAQEKNV